MTSRSLPMGIVLGVAAVLLAGCTGADAGAGRGGPHPSAEADGGQTFTANDLVGVLDRTGTTLGVDGQLVTDAQLKDAVGQVGSESGLIQSLGMRDVTYSPETCGTMVTDALAGGVPKDAIASQFRAGSTTITVASLADRRLTAAQKDAWTSTTDDALDRCSRVSVSFELRGTRMSAFVTMKKVGARTAAERTAAVEQTISFSSGDTNASSVSRTVVAVSGNLLISATSTRTDQTAEVEAQQPAVAPAKAVDTVVGVVRKGWRR